MRRNDSTALHAGFRHLLAGSILLVLVPGKRSSADMAQIRASIVIGVFFFLIATARFIGRRKVRLASLRCSLPAISGLWSSCLTLPLSGA